LHDGGTQAAGRSYLAVIPSSVQPSLQRWLAKDQAETPIAFCEERERFSMPRFPSSQTKVAPISQANPQAAIKAAMARAPTRHLSMKMKVEKRRLTKSDNPIQQLQRDIISDLYDAVRNLQVMVDPLILLLPAV
jgi:hypothetical protein